MNAYYIQDRLEAQSWARHYQQIAREEKVSTPRCLTVICHFHAR